MWITTAVLLLFGSRFPAAVLADFAVHGKGFTPDHILRVTVAQMPSACETREDVIINGTSPGPLIRVPPGARTWIRVYNDMKDRNITMHWHGLTQRLAPFADGTPQATQWPIPPGHFFDYELAPEVHDAGTYFYHSHVDMQALSAAGPLIVEDCGPPPHQYDDERILHFQDYFNKSDHDMMKGLAASPFVWAGEVHGVILNGKGVAADQTAVAGLPGGVNGYFGSLRGRRPGFYGRVRYGPHDGHGSSAHLRDEYVDDDAAGTFGAAASGYGGAPHCWSDPFGNQIEITDACILPVIDVEPGKTYRFRFIGGTGLSFLTMAFEDHDDLTVIQVDGGEYNIPVTTDHLQLGGGQRFDILFKAKTVEELKANGNKETYFLQFEARDRPEAYRGYGVLRYNPDAPVPAAPLEPVLSLPINNTDWLEYALRPLYPEKNEAPSAEEVTRRLIVNSVQKEDNVTGHVLWEVAHLSYKDTTQTKPVLIDIYERGAAALPNYEAALANYGWDPATKTFPAKLGEVIEIVFQNTGSQFPPIQGLVESHPFHAHGRHYYDIGSGPGPYDADANNAKLAELGFKSVKRDTTMLLQHRNWVAPGEITGWRGWRMRMTEPGVWMIHCHILAHMMMGMQTVWVVGDADDIIKIPLHLSKEYFTYGGSVYGNVTHDPGVYEYFDDMKKCRPGEDYYGHGLY
ncbi:Laccase-like multicopper oxidase 1 [Madurella fahalii]|uniref:Laccase-like multicopper oxidase 1 n=1 Tax=Madurella fahalii TaxID=1157608 RepID=A0ABQ0GEF9_9PEZI